MRLAVLLFALMLAVVAPTFANGPTMMNYQAVFMDQDGNIMPDGIYEVGFHIYTGPFGGPPIWSEWDSVTVANGVFEVTLGWGHPLQLSDFPAAGAWLGLSYDDVYLTPRQFIAAVPYAFYSCFADTARTADSSRYADSARVAGSVPTGGFKQLQLTDDEVSNTDYVFLTGFFYVGANSAVTYFATAIVEADDESEGVLWTGKIELLNSAGAVVAVTSNVKAVAPNDLFIQSLALLTPGNYRIRLTLSTVEEATTVFVEELDFGATWVPAAVATH